METLRRLCDDAFPRFSTNPLLNVDASGTALCYEDTGVLVKKIEKRLYAAGVRRGNFVCSWAPVGLEQALLAWACFRAGAVFIPVDHCWPAEMFRYVAAETAPRLIFADPVRYGALFPAKECSPGNRSFVEAEVVVYDDLDETTPGGAERFSDWLRDSATEGAPPEVSLAPEDPAAILYTSGSTGTPKGVVLSQGALYRSGRLVAEHFDWRRDDVFLNLGDLHVMSGLRNTCIAPLHAGCAAVLADERKRNSVFETLDLMERHSCTFIGCAPVMIRQLNLFASRARPGMLDRLRAALCTGGFLDPAQANKFHENFGAPALNYYGLTETSGLCAGHNFKTFRPGDDSIGPPVGAELQVVGPAGRESPDGVPGELRVRSRNLMLGYYRKPDLTAEILRDNWLYTGDIAVRRPEDGYFVLRGRCRNIIKNVYTDLIHLEEVEMALERHEKVREAAVCACATASGDEGMAAFIVPAQPLPEPNFAEFTVELRRFLEDIIGKRKIPTRFVQVGRLMRNAAGKLLREQMKKEFLDV